jgi:chloride channel, nucleotide-sensitive, 1A
MLQLAFPSTDEDEFNTIEMTVSPPAIPGCTAEETVKTLYDAISACTSLHPDPVDEDGEDDDEEYADKIIFEGDVPREALEGFTGVFQGSRDGGLPPPMPGSSGWITAENVHEYFDAEGNWIKGSEEEEGEGEGEGDGAGRVRGRDGVNGHDEEGESKKPRLD